MQLIHVRKSQMANIVGTSGNDTLLGTSGQDTINGLAGDDYIDGGAGQDVIIGGLGNDTLAFSYGYGPIFAVGSEGTDTFLFLGALIDVASIQESFYNYGNGDFDYFRDIYLVDGTHVGESIRSGGPLVEQFEASDTAVFQFIGTGGASTVNGGSANDLLPG